MSSQIKSTSGAPYTTRSMNGIITFDDGAGNVISNGQISSNGVIVDGDVEANNLLEADENETITGNWTFNGKSYYTPAPTSATEMVNLQFVVGTGGGTDGYVDLYSNQTINGVKSFVSSPTCPNPTTALQVANKGSYETFGYTNFCSLTDNNTISGINSFSQQVYLPNSNQTNDLWAASKGYVDNFGYTNFCSLTDDQTITGINSFSQQVYLPNSNQTNALMAASKGYVDTQISGIDYSGFVTLTGSQSITGIKTYTAGLKYDLAPVVNTDVVNKLALDTAISGIDYSGFVTLTGSQSITGIKTYTAGLKYDLAPVVNTDVVNKLALDSAISGIPAPSGVVLTTTNQNVGGVKTFTDILQLNTTGTSQKIKLWNGNGNEPASTAMGINALNAVTTGENNTAMGYSTLNILTTGSSNTCFGAYAGTSNTATGSTAVGAYSLTTNTGDYNTAVGFSALKVNTSATNNTAIGKDALKSQISGGQNTAIGADTLTASTTATYNTAVGAECMNITTGGVNTGVGANCLQYNVGGQENTAVGGNCMRFNTEGDHNVAMGRNTLYANTDGGENVAIGALANEDNTTAHYNIAIGYRAMRNKTGDANIYIGAETGANTSATSANDNVIVGHQSGQYITGERNTIIGAKAGQGMSSAYRNTIIGHSAGQNVESSCITSAFLGYYTGIVSGSGATNVVCIGNAATTSRSNIIVLGSGNIVTYCPYRIGIGTNVPTASLQIDNTLSKTYGNISDPKVTYFSFNANGAIGQFNFNGSNAYYLSIVTDGAIIAETYAGASDERIKENIIEVDDATSLQMIRDIPCRYYDYKDKVGNGYSKQVGFISQDVEKILPIAVSQITRHIPNEYRVLENITWTDGEVDVSGNVLNYKMSCDLTDVSGVDYKFFITNTIDDPKPKKETIVGNADNTFTFTEKYTHIFCYGKEVDDFRVLDKNKIFALHHSGIQEIDKQQIADKARITELESQVSDLTTRLTALEAHFNQ